MLDILIESFRDEWTRIIALGPRLLVALIVVGGFLIAASVIGRVFVTVLRQTKLTPIHQEFFRRLCFWLIAAFGLAAGLSVVGLTNLAAGLLASGGLTAVVLGFAFREIGENLLAGFFLAFSRPFNLGDWIQSGDFEGAVRGIQLRFTHIRSADGRDIFIPNSQIFNSPLVNFTLDGLRRPSFRVGIDYGDDASQACEVARKALQDLPGVLRDPPILVGIAALLPNYVELEVAFWIDTFDKSVSLPEVRTLVLDRCRESLRQNGFTLSTDVTSNLVLNPGPAPVSVSVSSDDEPATDPRQNL